MYARKHSPYRLTPADRRLQRKDRERKWQVALCFWKILNRERQAFIGSMYWVRYHSDKHHVQTEGQLQDHLDASPLSTRAYEDFIINRCRDNKDLCLMVGNEGMWTTESRWQEPHEGILEWIKGSVESADESTCTFRNHMMERNPPIASVWWKNGVNTSRCYAMFLGTWSQRHWNSYNSAMPILPWMRNKLWMRWLERSKD